MLRYLRRARSSWAFILSIAVGLVATVLTPVAAPYVVSGVVLVGLVFNILDRVLTDRAARRIQEAQQRATNYAYNRTPEGILLGNVYQRGERRPV